MIVTDYALTVDRQLPWQPSFGCILRIDGIWVLWVEMGFLEKVRILKPWESHYSGNVSAKFIYKSLQVQGT